MLPLLACAPEEAPATDPGPVVPLFSFVVLADPHVTGEGDNAERLRTAVEWINDNAEDRDIELVVIVGDIGWGDGVALSVELLGELAVTWVPVLGDNEIQFGSEEAFDAAFAPQYNVLAETTERFSRAATPVDNPDYGVPSWFQDFSFDHRGIHFVGLDWCSRQIGGIEGEMAELHDFEGGSWGWFAADLAGLGEGADDRVVLASHHPMHMSPGAFDVAEIDTLDALLETWDDAIYGNFAGHYHVTGDEEEPGRPLGVYVTDATWDDENALRVVSVSGNAEATEYVHEVVVLSG